MLGLMFGSSLGVLFVAHIIESGKFNKRKAKVQKKGIESSKTK